MAEKGLFVGLIPDGNRSWEKVHRSVANLQREHLVEAYKFGADAVKRIVEFARDARLGIFWTWGLSTKNLEARDSVQKEVLFETFEHFLLELRDVWMDKTENKQVRFVHMGRRDRLQERAPTIVTLLDEVTEHTRDRSGMILAIGLDYSGLDEGNRAHEMWFKQGCHGGPHGWKLFLDLPRQVEAMRELNTENNLTKPVNLVLRSKTANVSLFHDNECLHGYRSETRFDRIDEFLPAVTPEIFRTHLEAYEAEFKKHGA